MSPRNVTGLVDALESHGYLERRPHPTDLGRQTMARMAADREQAAAQLVSDLSDSQLHQLRHALDTVAGRLRRLVGAAVSEPRATG